MRPEDQNTLGRTGGASFNDTPTFAGNTPPPTLERGTLLSNGRYEILNLLGEGAMGAVYKAKDNELDRWVAIKVIQPMLVSTPSILKRFKQELILARGISHKNVVRIFDIAETDGMKFITMEYIDGGDLKSLIIERGKIPPQEAMDIVGQICKALQAAHAEGVVHRDLKPQNIMMDQNGRVVVMDFGIAHSQETPSMTMTGALMGTPEYMSPEQAKGEKTDARADIFAVGIILYEMLTGKIPFKAATVVETMFKRTQERAVAPAEIDPTLPKSANDIVVKCLQTEREQRYQSVTALLEDLETFDPTKKVGLADRAKVRLRKAARYRSAAVVVGLILLALTAGYMLRNRFAPPKPPAAHAPEMVLVADFSNHTDDAVFDGTLEPVVKMALEGAGFITAYDRTQMRSLGLQPVSGRLDEQKARQIALSQGLGVVITGSLDRMGQAYLVGIKATHAVTGKTITSAEGTATNKDQVLFATGKLAATVRKALGDDTSESTLRFAMETLTATSLEAVHEYATAMGALSNGTGEDALRSFSKAVDIDSNFGLAYAGMAIASSNLDRQQDAEKYVQLALGHMDHMTEREQYRTRAMYYLVLRNPQKCVEEYSSLVSRFPFDSSAHNNLALCWTQLRNMAKALEEMHQATAVFPKRAVYLYNTSVFASYKSDFQTAEREARTLQDVASSYPDGPIALAFAQLGQGQLTQAAETYQKLGKSSKLDPRSGLADVALYEGRFKVAASILEQGAAEDLAARSSDRAATKFAALAYTHLLQGQTGPAISAAERALANSKIVKIRFLSGRIFAAAGQTVRAQKLAAELASELQTEPQVYGKLIEGEVALSKGDARLAVKILTEANNLLDTWIGRFELGRAYLQENAFPEADSEFGRCIERRGEALALFLDESPTYGYFPQVYYYEGRVREGLKSPGSAEWYRRYLSIREKAGEDPLIADARKRIGQ